MTLPAWRHAVASIALCMLTLSAGAQTVSPLAGFHHRAWTAVDGAPVQIRAMAQTPDGWLWLGTADGLYRFDGVAFERVELPQQGMLARAMIYTLYAQANGDLWISHLMGGLSVLRADGSFEALPEMAGREIGPVSSIDVDRTGQVWVIGANGVYAWANKTWRVVVDGAKWSADDTRSLLRDSRGVLWAAFDRQAWRFDPASGRFVSLGLDAIRGALMQSPDGRIWTTRGDTAVQVSPDSQAPRDPRVNQTESRWGGQFDRAGNLWKIRCPSGTCLLPGAGKGTGLLDPARPGTLRPSGPLLSGVTAEQVLEDREGNIWIATENGLDRYQAHTFAPTGLPVAGAALSIAADAEGGVWAADARDGTVWRLQAGQPPQQEAGRYARVIGTARDGALLLSGKRSIERRLHGVVTQIPLPPGPDGQPVDLHVVGTLDDGKVLWMASFETGLMGYTGGKWLPHGAFNLPPKIVISCAGGPGQLWLADGDGGLTLYDNGKRTRYDAAVAGFATAVFADGAVMVAGARGMAVLQHGAMRLLATHRPDARHPDVLRNISGMAVTPDGDRWFNGAAGVVHVRAVDWQRALDHPGELLRYRLLDGRDGYPGQATTNNRLPSVVQGAGGQLWFAATGGVVRLETRTSATNPVAPTVQIQQVSTADASYRPGRAGTPRIDLPPGSSNVAIAYTAPALRRPENLRYAYRLDGVDSGWREGTGDRTATYTNVGPGQYVFRVRVTNEDGVTGATTAVQAVRIAPTMLQHPLFKALCAVLLVLLGVALYRYRIRVLTARLVERMQVRTSERERIARALHDTYLQSVHALMLRIGATARALPGDDPMRATLETCLADARSTVTEGRGQVEQLRAASAETLEAFIERSAGPLRRLSPGVAFDVETTGTPRMLAPRIVDEAGQICAEAIRNAFLHAGAQRIDVRIAYATSFKVTVHDDGKGFDEEVRTHGYRSGHWGLVGMRERARGIGAQLRVDSSPGDGVTIVLEIPNAYATVPGAWLAALRRRRRPA